MITKGIRGAITLESNTEDAVKDATTTLLKEIILKNSIRIDKISHVIFTLTDDLNAAFPAKFARSELGFDSVAMMCFHELNVPNSLKHCLRILLVLNCDEGFIPTHVYLKGAKILKTDLK
jgi:chorismate mutase